MKRLRPLQILVVLVLSQLAGAQELSECGPSRVEAPPYSVDRSVNPSGGSPELYLAITLDRQFLRPDSMRAFGRALNERFCRNRTVEASIFDDRRGATEWDPFHVPQLYATALRGEYFLDRETGKEYITFSTTRGRGFDEFINLGPTAEPLPVRTYTGAYKNRKYRYSVRIPPSLVGASTVPEELEGGINVSLSSGAGHYIWVGATENTYYFSALWWAIGFQRAWIEWDGAKVLSFTQSKRYRLGKLQARRLTVRYKEAGSDQVLVKDFLLALRNRKEEIGTLYRAEMMTTEGKYAEDRKTFERIVKSWRF
jgi:hypothetical protein